MSIKNKVYKAGLVDWKALKVLQYSGLKEISSEELNKLKSSLIKNQFVCTFYVWQEGETLWVLDGVHRIKALNELAVEGIELPDKFPANFIHCADRKEAANLVLVFSSYYARITQEGLIDFAEAEKLDLASLDYLNLPELDISGVLDDTRLVDAFLAEMEADNLQDLKKRDSKIKYRCNKCSFAW